MHCSIYWDWKLVLCPRLPHIMYDRYRPLSCPGLYDAYRYVGPLDDEPPLPWLLDEISSSNTSLMYPQCPAETDIAPVGITIRTRCSTVAVQVTRMTQSAPGNSTTYRVSQLYRNNRRKDLARPAPNKFAIQKQHANVGIDMMVNSLCSYL
jgi:hypothetical protein